MCCAFRAEAPAPAPPSAQKEHPRAQWGGSVRCQVAPRLASSAPAAAGEGTERAGLSLACQPLLPCGTTAVGGGVPRAQSTKAPSAPRQCPDAALPTQPALNSAHVWGQPLDPPHSSRDPARQEQTGLSGCMPARGDELLTRIILP